MHKFSKVVKLDENALFFAKFSISKQSPVLYNEPNNWMQAMGSDLVIDTVLNGVASIGQ